MKRRTKGVYFVSTPLTPLVKTDGSRRKSSGKVSRRRSPKKDRESDLPPSHPLDTVPDHVRYELFEIGNNAM